MKSATIVIAVLYVLVVLCGGTYRPIFENAGFTGLYFAVTMAGIAAVGLALIAFDITVVGRLVLLLSILFVAGWFGYETFIKKLPEEREPRMIMVFAIAAHTGIFVLASYFFRFESKQTRAEANGKQ